MKLKPFLAAFAVLAIAVALTACGSDESSDGTGNSETTSASTDATSTDPTSSDSSLAEAKEAVEEFTTRPTSIGIDTPIEGGIGKAKGKTIYDISCATAAAQTLVEVTQEAGDAAGITIKESNSGFTPETVKAAWENALRAEPDGIISVCGFPYEFYEAELAEAEAKGIPVVTVADGQPAEKGLVSISGPDRARDLGRNLAKVAYAETEGKKPMLMVTSSAYTTVLVTGEGFEEELKELCPECDLEVYDAPAEEVGGGLSGKVASYLQAHPDIEYLVMAYGDFATGLPGALKAAGIDDMPWITQEISANPSYVLNGETQGAFLFPIQEVAWRTVDTFIRIFNDQKVEPDVASSYPAWMVTESNAPDDLNAKTPLVENFEEQYLDLWGLE